MSLEPENKPTLDHATLLPILLGVFSLFGILLVFVVGRISAGRNALPVENTATPFKYQLIGTEPGISTAVPLVETTASPYGSFNNGETPNGTSSNDVFPNASPTRKPGLVVTAQQGSSSGSGSSSGGNSPTKTKTSSSAVQTIAGNATDPIIIFGTRSPTPVLVIIERTDTPTRTPGPTITNTPSRTKSVVLTNTPSRTPTTSTQVPLLPGTYDDSHPLLAYHGWNSITDSTAYLSTLHVSSTTDSTITFRYIGQQIRITFQSGLGFGTISASIDGLVFPLSEDSLDTGSEGASEWSINSANIGNGTHTVVITHTLGGSVNIDSIIIPDTNTPTPTSTPTATATQ